LQKSIQHLRFFALGFKNIKHTFASHFKKSLRRLNDTSNEKDLPTIKEKARQQARIPHAYGY